MKLVGEKIFARDASGRLLSRIGTIFFKTPGLVTIRGVHAMQRIAWLADVNATRAAAGQEPMSEEEENQEIAESVDLIFTDSEVLIRPNPDRMDLAFRADRELQNLVSKRAIRFLNTNSLKVRTALRERGENWRMARQPISQDDMIELIGKSRVALAGLPIYYYNPMTGTRYITASGYGEIERLEPAAFRRQIAEIVKAMGQRNRLGHLEVDVFPSTTPIGIRQALQSLNVDALDDAVLKAACDKIALDWRMALPARLRDENVRNFEWRNEMCFTITRQSNETVAEEQNLIAGISPEFYRQIEWLPGARIEDGRVVFDEIYDEAARTKDPQLLAMCDSRVKSFIFNRARQFGRIRYINVGRIAKSLARKPVEGSRKGDVYIMQCCEEGASAPEVLMIRLQKWGIAEHLDEGKNLEASTYEADQYTDYILDRRLMCRQLGMDLPSCLNVGFVAERYDGEAAEYRGHVLRTVYFTRAYVTGVASDKVPLDRYRNPAYAHKFADLMGAAAALDLVVGRRNSVTDELMFDKDYEVIQIGADGLPASITITDHAGSFVNYEGDFAATVGAYAEVVRRRRDFVTDYKGFAETYVAGFRRGLAEVQAAYRAHKTAFDELFAGHPYDPKGSGAYRWERALKRLDACDPAKVADLLKAAIGC